MGMSSTHPEGLYTGSRLGFLAFISFFMMHILIGCLIYFPEPMVVIAGRAAERPGASLPRCQALHWADPSYFKVEGGLSEIQQRFFADSKQSGGIFLDSQCYDKMCGLKGASLSGGQKQRIAIARALIRDPRLLILDEATSAVDNETEAALQRSISKVSKNRTTVIIAHRLSTIRNADRIIVLENGDILEDGTHEELVDKRGAYARLWAVQTGELESFEN